MRGVSIELAPWIRHLTQMHLNQRPASVKVARQLLHQPMLSPDLARSTSLKLASRIPIPDHCRFHIHRVSSDLLVIGFSNSRFRMQNLTTKDFSIFNIISQIFTWGISGMVGGTTLFIFLSWLSLSGWITFFCIFCIIISIGLVKCDQHIQNRKYRVIQIDQTNIYLSGCIQIRPAELLKQHRSGVDEVPNILWKFNYSGPISKHKVWEIDYYKCPELFWSSKRLNHHSFLKLKIGDQVWQFTGDRQEIAWLLGELSHYLQMPAFADVPPVSTAV
jgi:hypothetical protein